MKTAIIAAVLLLAPASASAAYWVPIVPPAPTPIEAPKPVAGGGMPFCSAPMAPGWITGPGGTFETGKCANGITNPAYANSDPRVPLYLKLVDLLQQLLALKLQH